MNFWNLIILSVGLAMDATAVSLGCSLSDAKARKIMLIKAALFFGIFQAVMPLIGYFLGTNIKDYVREFDHWIAFALLLFVGGKMIIDSGKDDNGNIFDNKNLLILAVATSIDALVVGITFSFIKVNLILSVVTIGIVTFGLSLAAGLFGRTLKNLNARYLKIGGGAAIIFIGTKILIDHLISK